MSELLSLLEEVLGDSERRSHGNYRFKCLLPDCASVRKRLEIQLETDEEGHNRWHCWVCGRGGKTIKDLFYKINADPGKIRILSTLVVAGETIQAQYEPVKLPVEFVSLQNIPKSDIIGRNALAYLRSRMFTPEDVIKYNLGYCETGRYHHRIVIPSYDAQGRLNYFIARSFTDDGDWKYDYPQAKRSEIIPFELLINWSAPLILCEGFFDMKAIGRNCVPLLGKEISNKLLQKIMRSDVRKIYIVLDRDALKESLKHAAMLMANGKTVYLAELTDKDPGKMGFSEFTGFIQNIKALTHESLFQRRLEFSLS